LKEEATNCANEHEIRERDFFGERRNIVERARASRLSVVLVFRKPLPVGGGFFCGEEEATNYANEDEIRERDFRKSESL